MTGHLCRNPALYDAGKCAWPDCGCSPTPHQPSAPPRVSQDTSLWRKQAQMYGGLSDAAVGLLCDEIDVASAEIAALRASMASDRRRAWEACREAAAKVVATTDHMYGYSHGDRIRALQPPEPDDARALTPPQEGSGHE